MPQVEIISIKVDEKQKEEIINYYKNFQMNNNNEYIIFFAKKDNITISLFENKKGNLKLVLKGENALKEAKKWDENAIEKNSKSKRLSWINTSDQIGSDEVGTGDFFGPVCVCASFIKESDIPFLKKLGVNDSKKLNDEQIIKIGKELIKKIPYSQLSLDNEKYNKLYEQGLNLNEIKAKMHNQVLLNLKNKYKINNIFVDQFATIENYYKYLKDVSEIVTNINFKTKGETYFPSVAVSSIIARYSFLQKMEKLSKKYKMDIPFGAGSKIKTFSKKFIKAYGLDEFNKIVKKNFVTYNEIIKLL